MQRKYYEAYDDRYRQVHGLDLQWFHDAPTPIVMETISKYGITKDSLSLELGCGEGRDAIALLKEGHCLTATDISPEAIRFCRERNLEYADRFQVMDCLRGTDGTSYDFIYAVAVLHMLVLDEDRSAFYRFFHEHLQDKGVGLICTMGDGSTEYRSDNRNAFDLQERKHGQTGNTVRIASTSCRVVNFETFQKELEHSGLSILNLGITSSMPDFPQMMYAVIHKGGPIN